MVNGPWSPASGTGRVGAGGGGRLSGGARTGVRSRPSPSSCSGWWTPLAPGWCSPRIGRGP